MKKRFLVLAVCICAVIGAVISAAGAVSQTNSLISKSYLENIYWQEVQGLITERVSTGLSTVRNAALQVLDSIGDAYLSQLKPAKEGQPDWLVSGDLLAQTGVVNDTITLDVGAGLVWTEGSASFVGTLIDTTAGEEVPGGVLAVNHRYVAPEQVVITVTSSSAAWSVEGQWLTTGQNVEEDPIEPPVPVVSFVDVPEGSWYHDAVYYVVERGLFQGTGENTFAPDMTMTRGMMTTVLYRMSDSPEVTYSAVFSDVPDGAWYTTGTVWAGLNGVVNGTGNGKFTPNGELTREQIAQMLYNYANWLGLDTSARGDVTGFADTASISAWAADAVSWAVGVGLFQGNTENNLIPTAAATRAQVATLLQRFDLWMYDYL